MSGRDDESRTPPPTGEDAVRPPDTHLPTGGDGTTESRLAGTDTDPAAPEAGGSGVPEAASRPGDLPGDSGVDAIGLEAPTTTYSHLDQARQAVSDTLHLAGDVAHDTFHKAAEKVALKGSQDESEVDGDYQRSIPEREQTFEEGVRRDDVLNGGLRLSARRANWRVFSPREPSLSWEPAREPATAAVLRSFKKNRIALVHTIDFGLSRDLASYLHHKLATRAQQRGKSLRTEFTTTDIDANSVTERVEENTLLILDLRDPNQSEQKPIRLDTLNDIVIDSLSERLKDHDEAYLLILSTTLAIPPHLLRSMDRDDPLAPIHFEVADLWLQRECGPRAREVQEEIARQRDNGWWPQDVCDHEREIIALRTLSEIEAAIAARRTSQLAERSLKEEVKSAMDDELGRALLFVANLTEGEPVETFVATVAPVLGDDRLPSAEEDKPGERLVDVFDRHRRLHMERCHLRQRQVERSDLMDDVPHRQTVVDFTQTEVRNIIRAGFANDWYGDGLRLGERILTSDLLFHARPEVGETAARYLVERAAQAPESWLQSQLQNTLYPHCYGKRAQRFVNIVIRCASRSSLLKRVVGEFLHREATKLRHRSPNARSTTRLNVLQAVRLMPWRGPIDIVEILRTLVCADDKRIRGMSIKAAADMLVERGEGELQSLDSWLPSFESAEYFPVQMSEQGFAAARICVELMEQSFASGWSNNPASREVRLAPEARRSFVVRMLMHPWTATLAQQRVVALMTGLLVVWFGPDSVEIDFRSLVTDLDTWRRELTDIARPSGAESFHFGRDLLLAAVMMEWVQGSELTWDDDGSPGNLPAELQDSLDLVYKNADLGMNDRLFGYWHLFEDTASTKLDEMDTPYASASFDTAQQASDSPIHRRFLGARWLREMWHERLNAETY